MAIRNVNTENQMEILKELGQRLAGIREAQGLTIDDIAQHTKIQRRYLTAIEAGELEQLPKGPYVRSFVRQYCEYLSAMDLWSTYDALTKSEPQASRASLEVEQDYSSPPKVFKPTSYWWVYLLIIASLAAAGWITWRYRGEIGSIATSPIDGGTAPIAASRDSLPAASEDVETLLSGDAAVSEDAVSQDVSEPAPAQTDLSWMDGNTAPPAAPSAGAAVQRPASPAVSSESGTLNISATGNVWLRVSRDSQLLYQGTIRSGESKSFPVAGSQKPIRVRYGNPANAVVGWNGKVENPLGSSSKPLTRYYWPDGRVTEGD
ncbi:DUF4115 domain-containing protein [Synergistaceae bacterium OttesenSCG-928-D05]|nr:DUF4115 domain-containing protein [Synergistaceae bacterium OttesenSCG-928-D05]